MSEFEYGLFGSQGELVGRTYRREDQARYEMGNAALAWKVTLELRRREIGPWVSLPVEEPQP